MQVYRHESNNTIKQTQFECVWHSPLPQTILAELEYFNNNNKKSNEQKLCQGCCIRHGMISWYRTK